MAIAEAEAVASRTFTAPKEAEGNRKPAKLLSSGREIDTRPEVFGALRRSDDLARGPDDLAGVVEGLRERMREDGYVYLPGYLERERVMETRAEVTRRLATDGFLDQRFPSIDSVAAEDCKLKFKPDLARNNAPLHDLLYAGRMTAFFRALLGGPILHFDFTWMRAVAPGKGTRPHGDIVFMGRGTPNLYTAWTPLGDISLEQGGLMILEGSHQLERVHATYSKQDVDAYCENYPTAEQYASGQKKGFAGYISTNPVKLRERLGGRWLTNAFTAGDLLVFGMFTLHCSLDNQSRHIRLSTDSRYQLASEPADHRWIGEAPIGHSLAGKRGRIC
ncbi:MAG: putative dehydrogenases [uncultured Chloroflexi bacterium]|uniref:Putative dehydrogenases n=1 Tax=uncultured Chloroflexota bacterium TaxID=166587 RepID=A0A6J4J7U7_9CHLR|nr:MAG: putative dehydrogenases [uncultured Chloroflexota bacterium]